MDSLRGVRAGTAGNCYARPRTDASRSEPNLAMRVAHETGGAAHGMGSGSREIARRFDSASPCRGTGVAPVDAMRGSRTAP